MYYTKEGMTLNDMRLKDGRHPTELYIKTLDKIEGIQETQKGFNQQLGNDVKPSGPVKVKETLVTVAEETMIGPRSGTLEGVFETVDILVSDYARESDVIKKLLDIAYTDYSTILHSINVMIFSLVFTSYSNFPRDDARVLGLSGLFLNCQHQNRTRSK